MIWRDYIFQDLENTYNAKLCEMFVEESSANV